MRSRVKALHVFYLGYDYWSLNLISTFRYIWVEMMMMDTLSESCLDYVYKYVERAG